MNSTPGNAPISFMHSRQTIALTSQGVTGTSSQLPKSPSIVPQQIRYEDRRSTLIIESDRPLSPTYLSKIFTLPEIAEGMSLDDPLLPSSPSSSSRSVGDFPKPRTTPRVGHHRKSHRSSDHASLPSTPGSPSPPKSPDQRSKILFYHKHDPHYGFTNFSDHSVIYNGKKYSTSEHLFQSFKFHDHRPGLAEHIRTCSERPSVAFSEARRFQPEVRPDWKQVNITMMDIALEHKFTQHQDLKEELLATGNAELVEDSDKDSFWGVGADGKGRNELGKALERLRDKLRHGLEA